MKKLSALFTALFMLVSLTACQSFSAGNSGTNTSSSAVTNNNSGKNNVSSDLSVFESFDSTGTITFSLAD